MDQIRIEGLEVYARHGVFPEENKLGQKFIVNAILKEDTRSAGLRDDLNESVDYGNVSQFIDCYLKENTWKLIEAVAENLAQAILLKYNLVKEVEIEIKKPWAPIGLPLQSVSVCITRAWHEAYIALGSNLGNREEYLKMAVEELQKDYKCRVELIANPIETKPYGVENQPDFLNSCVKIETLYTPLELLQLCNRIEAKAERKREMHWGPRTLDLDILLYDDLVLSEPNLIIPHIEMHKRRFVLEPLAQIAPYIVHPILKKRIVEILEEL